MCVCVFVKGAVPFVLVERGFMSLVSGVSQRKRPEMVKREDFMGVTVSPQRLCS